MKWVNSGFIFYYPHQSERNCLSLILPILLVMWISPTDLPTKLSETSVDAKHVLMGSMTFQLLLDRVGFCAPCCQAAWLL